MNWIDPWGLTKTGAAIGGTIGSVLGGWGGSVVGGIIGGAGGGLAGSTVGPGGTIVGAGAGGSAGATWGGAAGAAGGGLLGAWLGDKISNIFANEGNDGECPNDSDLSDKPNKIAEKTGYSPKEIKDAIHEVKKNMPRGGPVRNPDVNVDVNTGEVYPQNGQGGSGDSIGNIFDHLP